MVKKKEIDVKIKIAIISGIFLVIAYGISAYLGSPLADTQWKERPIADFSFGNMDGIPYDKLPMNEGIYYVDIMMENRGGSDAKLTLIAQGTNTKVRIGDVGDFDYQHILIFTKKVSPVLKYPIYLIPDENAQEITIGLSYEVADQNPMFQEINLYTPVLLTYNKTSDGYVLIDKR